MNWVEPTSLPASRHGGVRVVPATDLATCLGQAEARGLLPLTLPAPGPALRGRLALAIEECIETALEIRGACPPGIGAAVSLDASLADQLYRARLLELRGIALALPTLEGIADLGATLDGDDSAVVRFWLAAARQHPVCLLLEDSNLGLGVYRMPARLGELLAAEPTDAPAERAQALAPEVAASSGTMELSEPPPAVFERDGALAFEAADDDDDDEPSEEWLPEDVERSAQGGRRNQVERSAEGGRRNQVERSAEGGRREHEDAPVEAARAEPNVGSSGPPKADAANMERAREEGPTAIGDIAEAILMSLADRAELGAERGIAAGGFLIADASPEPPAATDEPEERESAERRRIDVPPLYPEAAAKWPSWVEELERARGPKPLAVVERMFVTSYVPLSDARARGIAAPEAGKALDVWSASFAQSYREAFDALRVRGKRPTMVLDAPELALRIGRLHGARSVQLLLVDGMRFDLGLRIEQRVRVLLGQQAALTERLLLWSALPATTAVQLELLGRGATGLREFAGEPPSETVVARGRAASTLRRVKAGPRDLLKLDVVEARLAEPGPAEPARLDAIADESASVLADYLQGLVPRTLVFAFGDHGFLLDALDAGTAAARSGGSSPEEVLVPAFAWLVGGVH